MQSLRPVNGNLLLTPLEDRKITEGGIHIPDSAAERKNQGIVLEIDEDDTTSICKVGDTVIFPTHNEYRLKHKGMPYIIVHPSHVIAVIDNE